MFENDLNTNENIYFLSVGQLILVCNVLNVLSTKKM